MTRYFLGADGQVATVEGSDAAAYVPNSDWTETDKAGYDAAKAALTPS